MTDIDFVTAFFFIIFINIGIINVTGQEENILELGFCRIILDSKCPHSGIEFYLYTQDSMIPEQIFLEKMPRSKFEPSLPTKIIVHGYNSDMELAVLKEIRRIYLQKGRYNVFAVNWSPWAQAPCYPAAVWNTRTVGKCISQLVDAIRHMGSEDIHAIGFSLGAHVLSFTANSLHPYKLPRITGLDPAMPGFSTVPNNLKLDEDDAHFVDVIHTNAFFQGTFYRSGHVDFYVNGGIAQPGCWAEERFFACNHHRAPLYFAESIITKVGFWSWPCESYFMFFLGNCPPREPQILMGEYVDKTARGMYLVITNSISPYALGKYTGPLIEIVI